MFFEKAKICAINTAIERCLRPGQGEAMLALASRLIQSDIVNVFFNIKYVPRLLMGTERVGLASFQSYSNLSATRFELGGFGKS